MESQALVWNSPANAVMGVNQWIQDLTLLPYHSAFQINIPSKNDKEEGKNERKKQGKAGGRKRRRKREREKKSKRRKKNLRLIKIS